MAKIRNIQQPEIDPESRPSEARKPWRGILLAVVGLALLLMGAHASHTVYFGGSNQKVSQSKLVRTVTANLVQRPLTGQPTTQSVTTNLQKDSGQADCPT